MAVLEYGRRRGDIILAPKRRGGYANATLIVFGVGPRVLGFPEFTTLGGSCCWSSESGFSSFQQSAPGIWGSFAPISLCGALDSTFTRVCKVFAVLWLRQSTAAQNNQLGGGDWCKTSAWPAQDRPQRHKGHKERGRGFLPRIGEVGGRG